MFAHIDCWGFSALLWGLYLTKHNEEIAVVIWDYMNKTDVNAGNGIT